MKYFYCRIVRNNWRNLGQCVDRNSLAFLILLSVANIANTQQVLSIGEIQGESLFSDYIGETISTKNAVVTFQGPDYTIIQSAGGLEDGNPKTSDAMSINIGISQIDYPVGSTINITGKIIDNGETAFSLQNLSIEKVPNQAMPLAISLKDFFDQDIAWTEEVLERMEFMSVNGNGGIVTEPSDQYRNLSIYFTEDRPRREPGISAPGIVGLPEFDNNLESIHHLPINGTNPPDIPAGSTLTSYGFFLSINQESYLISETFDFTLPPLLLDIPTAPSSIDKDQFTLASCNLLIFDASDFNFPPRLEKMVNYIHTGLGLPDVVAVQEIADLTTLILLKNELNSRQEEKSYTAYLENGNNGTFINSGFLVSDRVEVEEVKKIGGNQSFSLGGSLHDRPPLYLKGKLKTNPEIPFSILNLHLRSLSGIEGSNQTFVRKKRWEQAVSVSNIVENIYDENLFILGDFNAYPFSDGYVDVYHQIQGGASEGAEREVSPVDYPALSSASELLPQAEQYSFVFDGHTQLLDHLLYTPLEDLSEEKSYFYHENSNNPDSWVSRTDRPTKVSDHDGLLFAMEPAYLWNSTESLPSFERPYVQYQNPFPMDGTVNFFPAKGDIYTLKVLDGLGRLVYEEKSSFLNDSANFSFSPILNADAGLFYFQILGQDYEWVEPILFIR